MTNHQAQITVHQAVSGWQYVLQTSTNLTLWSPILTNTAATNTLQMLDPNPVDKSHFYRAIIP